jgi:hypothetical protein
MSFESAIIAFSTRFLSGRSFDLIVAPALADLDFEHATRRCGAAGSRMAVLRAVAGALQHEMRHGSVDFVKLTLLSFCYFIFPLTLGIGIFETWSDFALAAMFVLGMSLVPVMVCFWPTRHTMRPE